MKLTSKELRSSIHNNSRIYLDLIFENEISDLFEDVIHEGFYGMAYDLIQEICFKYSRSIDKNISIFHSKYGMIDLKTKILSSTINIVPQQYYCISYKILQLKQSTGLPILIKYKSKYFIEDGHHTMLHQLSQSDVVSFKVINLNKIIKLIKNAR